MVAPNLGQCLPAVSITELFLLSKSPQYFFDHEAIKEPTSDNPVSAARRNRKDFSTVSTKAIQGTVFGQSGRGKMRIIKGKREISAVSGA